MDSVDCSPHFLHRFLNCRWVDIQPGLKDWAKKGKHIFWFQTLKIKLDKRSFTQDHKEFIKCFYA